MKVSPSDIRKKSFDKVTFGGYNKEDVHAFLNALSAAWENTLARNSELETKLGLANNEIARLRDMESSLLNALKKNEESGKLQIEQSKREAEINVMESRLKADQITADAQNKTKTMLLEANQQVYQSLANMREALRRLDVQYKNLERQKNELSAQLRKLSYETINELEKMEKTEPPNTSYDEEIKKANAFMKQNNDMVKETVENNGSNLTNNSKNTPVAPYLNGKKVQTVVKPQEENIISTKKIESASFFDTL